jgi:Uncharacterised protein family (UPF0158)
VLDPQSVDLEMLTTALADQGGFEHQWLFDPLTGQTHFRSDDTDDDTDGDTDGDTEGDPEDRLLRVDPLPSWVWYQDMVDFAELVGDEQAGRRLGRALQGKGAFRRFTNVLHGEHPQLVAPWNAFRDTRAVVRAVEWLWDNDVVTYERYQQFCADHPDPVVP